MVSWVSGYHCDVGVKMTFELPAELAKQLKVRAAEDGVKLKDLVAEACRLLLVVPKKRNAQASTHKPLPTFFKGGHPAKAGEELTPEKVDEILWGLIQ